MCIDVLIIVDCTYRAFHATGWTCYGNVLVAILFVWFFVEQFNTIKKIKNTGEDQ
jgi:hypothetical protein